MAEWTASYEQIPKGSDLGATTCAVLRSLKSEFKTRFVVEHEIDAVDPDDWEGDSTTTAYHKIGECQVVKMADGVPTAEDVASGVLCDYTNKTLYRDDGGGGGINAVSTLDHDSLGTNLLDPDAHTKYIEIAGETMVTTPTNPIDLGDYRINNLTETEATYDSNTTYVLPKVLHLKDATNDDAHKDDCITSSNIPTDFRIPESKFKVVKASRENQRVVGQTNYKMTFKDYSFAPVPTTLNGSGGEGFLLCPDYGNSPPNDSNYVPKINFYNTDTSAQTLNFDWFYMDS